MKLFFIALAFVAILGALVSAGVFMVRKPTPREADKEPKAPLMMRALALRVALSIALFACIWIAYHLGWIQPTGLPTR
jgi:type VI protein secretion system component VasK